MQPKSFSSKSLAVLMGCVSLAALASAARAQSVGVETVMVTVEHRAENSQDVPISTSTLSGENLDTIFQSGDDIKAIANHTPSLYAESSNGRAAPRFYIRGLGNADFDLAASQPVSVIMDDVVMENVVLKSTPLFDLQNVEVDRGPQGTLFGRNTTAGIVKFTSVRPSQAESAYLEGNAGQLSTASVQGAYGNAITDTLSFRLSGLWQHRDHWIDNAFTGQQAALGGYEERAARLQFLWEASDNFSALLNLHGRSLDGTAAIFRANIFTPSRSGVLNGNYKDDTVFFDGGANNPQRYDGLGAGLTLTYDLPGVTITSITGYETTHGFSRGDIDGGNMVSGPGFIPFPSDTQDGLDYLHQLTEELRFASGDTASPLFWQFGGYYFDTGYQDTTNPFFTGPTSVHQSNSSFALFGQASYKWEGLTATGGVRYTTDIKAMTATTLSFFPSTITTPVKTRGSNVSWDASLAYALDTDFNIYGRAASGFRAPSIQGRNLAFGSGYSTARSETVQSFEAGFKSLLADHTLRLNADVFQYYVHNMQFTAVGGAGNSIILVNAKGGNAYGVEVDAEWVPNDSWDLTAGFSWNHTAIRDPNLRAGVCAQCTVTDPVVGGFAQINNNPFPQAPLFILSTSAKYTWPLANGSSLYAYAGGWVQGYTNFFLYELKEFQSDGNYQIDLRLGWSSASKRYDFYGYIQNVTDKKNVQGGIDFNNLTGFVGEPRVVGLGLAFHL